MLGKNRIGNAKCVCLFRANVCVNNAAETFGMDQRSKEHCNHSSLSKYRDREKKRSRKPGISENIKVM